MFDCNWSLTFRRWLDPDLQLNKSSRSRYKRGHDGKSVRLHQAATRMYEMARRNSMLRLTEADPAEDEEVIVD
jgi:hypothetical protein